MLPSSIGIAGTGSAIGPGVSSAAQTRAGTSGSGSAGTTASARSQLNLASRRSPRRTSPYAARRHAPTLPPRTPRSPPPSAADEADHGEDRLSGDAGGAQQPVPHNTAEGRGRAGAAHSAGTATTDGVRQARRASRGRGGKRRSPPSSRKKTQPSPPPPTSHRAATKRRGAPRASGTKQVARSAVVSPAVGRTRLGDVGSLLQMPVIGSMARVDQRLNCSMRGSIEPRIGQISC